MDYKKEEEKTEMWINHGSPFSLPFKKIKAIIELFEDYDIPISYNEPSNQRKGLDEETKHPRYYDGYNDGGADALIEMRKHIIELLEK